MKEEILKYLNESGKSDSIIIIKDGSIDSINHLDYGELNIKFYDKKIKHVDVTKKTKY